MNYKLDCNCKLSNKMRRLCPVPGIDYKKLMLVELKPGESVSPHEHHGHTVLYYPESASPVVITPTKGTMIYLPPHTLHSVPAALDDRVSVAMIIESL